MTSIGEPAHHLCDVVAGLTLAERFELLHRLGVFTGCSTFPWTSRLFRDRAMALWRLSDVAARVEAALREDLGEGQGDVGEGLERE